MENLLGVVLLFLSALAAIPGGVWALIVGLCAAALILRLWVRVLEALLRVEAQLAETNKTLGHIVEFLTGEPYYDPEDADFNNLEQTVQDAVESAIQAQGAAEARSIRRDP